MNKYSVLNTACLDLLVEGRVTGNERSELVVEEEDIGVYRLDSPTHPAFWAKITTPLATQTIDNLICQILQREDSEHGHHQLSPISIMKGFAKFYLEKWEKDPSQLIDHIDKWGGETVHWPIFNCNVLRGEKYLVGIDRQFYNILVRAGGLDKYKVNFIFVAEEPNDPQLNCGGGSECSSVNILLSADWSQFTWSNYNYAVLIQPK